MMHGQKYIKLYAICPWNEWYRNRCLYNTSQYKFK